MAHGYIGKQEFLELQEKFDDREYPFSREDDETDLWREVKAKLDIEDEEPKRLSDVPVDRRHEYVGYLVQFDDGLEKGLSQGILFGHRSMPFTWHKAMNDKWYSASEVILRGKQRKVIEADGNMPLETALKLREPNEEN